MDYSDFSLQNTPETIVYIPNFITSEEEQHILSSVYAAPKPKWTQLSRRRLQNYGGIPHKNGMIAESIPSWLQVYVEKVNYLGIFDINKANHVLVNEYLPGQGIMAHGDGPLFSPTISTISCGSHTILEFINVKNNVVNCDDYNKVVLNESDNTVNKINNLKKPCLKLLIEPRSLLILKKDMYINYLHQISELEEDTIDESIVNLTSCEHVYDVGTKLKRERRISLTIRHVPKTTKIKLQF